MLRNRPVGVHPSIFRARGLHHVYGMSCLLSCFQRWPLAITMTSSAQVPCWNRTADCNEVMPVTREDQSKLFPPPPFQRRELPPKSTARPSGYH